MDEDRERLNRAYIGELTKFMRSNPYEILYVYDYLPDGFHRWGVNGALTVCSARRDMRTIHLDMPGAEDLIQSGSAAWVHWERRERKLYVIRYPRQSGMASYMTMQLGSPASQLVSGWYALEPGFRWMQRDAAAVLQRPEGAREFEIIANVMPEQVSNHRTVDLRILLNGQRLDRHIFTGPGWQTVHWPLAAAPAGATKVEFHVAPPYHSSNGDSRIFGVAVKGFGFVRR